MEELVRLQSRIRNLILFFVVMLILSGITAFPLAWEMQLLSGWFGIDPAIPPSNYNGLKYWLAWVSEGVRETDRMYPFIAYGTDWLAFAHIVIGVAFIGPLRDPVRNIWVIEFGMIACVLVIPLALIAGPIRGIPFYWQLIDCSFGVLGIIPLAICRNMILKLERLSKPAISN